MRTFNLAKCYVLLSLVLLRSGASCAQGKPGEPTGSQATIKVRTTLVTIPAIVTDRSGNHLDDLKEGDFVVLRDGKIQKIGLFRHVRTNAEVMQPTTEPANGLTNAVEYDNQRMTIFVIDFLNFSFTEQRTAKEQLLKFLSKSLDVKEPISLLALDQTGIRVIHDFTTDPAVLAQALKRVTEQPSGKERPISNPIEGTYRLVAGWNSRSASRNAAMAQSRLNTLNTETQFQALGMRASVGATLEALREIGEAFAGIPGRKSMVWATGGFPFEIDDAATFGLRDRALLPAYERAWRALNLANIAVYPLDVEALLNPAYVGAGIGRPLPQHMHPQMNGTNFEKFAAATGGKFCDRREDAESCFREAANDSSDYYLIGIYTSADDAKPGWKKISVKVRRPDVQVRARSGYYEGPPKDEKQQIKEDIEVALDSPFDYTSVPVGVRWSVAKEPDEYGKKKIEFMYVLAPGVADLDESDNNHLSLEFAAVAKNPKGLPEDAFSKAVEGHLTQPMAGDIKANGVKFPGTMKLSSGEYTLTFAVRDNLRRLIGSVSSVVKIP